MLHPKNAMVAATASERSKMQSRPSHYTRSGQILRRRLRIEIAGAQLDALAFTESWVVISEAEVL